MKYTTLNSYLKEKFGCKVYKISLDCGFTCPNRDGTLGYGGCIFCSKGGSGDFAESRTLGVTEQIESGKEKVKNKIKSGKYIAYFQAFTNTYADVNTLEKMFSEAINHPDIVALSIATRPDCLEQEKVELLSRLNKIKPIFVELGLQTVNEKTAKYISRGYTLDVYDDAVERLHEQGINVVTHIIIGLPYETKEDMLSSVKYVCKVTDGIKLQLLHILKGTDLAKDYFEHKFEVLSLEEYTNIIAECVKIIPENVVIHRLTGDGAKKDLIAPLWSANKKKVLNTINKRLSEI
ncbi:TIGR01212 family radical SAM protein [uncultured Eubacterium sp.]|uniref:TIGR01212 family radical SAM protein n=1 Tax=uncultured Eubacterium sp. TaxID=165185 RepID=UPI0026010268|nr:TIGR01212 family radical SAM protein [uncultured Eubacterium sp.]